MSDPNQLTVVQAAVSLRTGDISSEELVTACLNRIDARESTVRAWVAVDAEGALDAARRCDADAAQDHWHGPLHGIPFGIKDIFDVEGLETRAGTDAWPAKRAERDAASVARLRHAGAIMLGKTVTTAFATGDPGPTTNPWNPDRTPGGSSSGSAASVADRMCLAALGTQTAGSVIRPCSFNGLAGIKPGHGRVDIRGVIPLAWRLDHVGALTRDVADAHLVWQVLRDDDDWRERAGVDGLLVPVQPERPLRLWRMRGLFESFATPAVAKLIDDQCTLLADRGVTIIERPLPAGFENILDMHRIVMASEAAAVHAENFALHGDKYPPQIRAHIEEGQTISATTYLAARQHRRQLLQEMTECLTDVDGAISGAAAEAAPVGLAHTGERAFNVPSSYLGLPTVCYPAGLDETGMPLGLQIMGRPGTEDELLAITQWCETLAGFDAMPD